GDQNYVLQVRRRLGVVENLIVEGVVEADAEMRLQRRVSAPDVVEPGDLGDDVAGRLPIPGADFVFLRRGIFLAAGQRARLAQLKPAIDAKEARQGRGERRTDQEN